jgi:hypothetical protein
MTPAFLGGPYISMRQYEDNYSPNINIARAEAKKLFGDNRVVFNRKLRDYSRAVFRLRQGKCLLWAAYMIPRTAAKVPYRCWFLWIFAPLAAFAVILRQRMSRGAAAPAAPAPRAAPPPPAAAGQAASTSRLLAAACFLAALFYLGLVSVLIVGGSYADSRLVVPGAVFVPSVLLLLVLGELQTIARIVFTGKRMMSYPDPQLIADGE